MWSQCVWLSRIVARSGRGTLWLRSMPRGRAPVPQSKISRSPWLVMSSTHIVLPPNRTVEGPGVAIDPRVPQKRTRMVLLLFADGLRTSHSTNYFEPDSDSLPTPESQAEFFPSPGP